MKAQASAEFMLIIVIASMLFIFTLLVFNQGIFQINSGVERSLFVDFLQAVYGNADQLSSESLRFTSLYIPENLAYNVSATGNGWFVSSFTFENKTYSRQTPYKLSFLPTNFTSYPGRHAVKIYSNQPGDVVVEIVS